MKGKGTGYSYEILMAMFVLFLAMAFFLSDSPEIMPPLLMLVGGVMILGGLVTREPLIVAGGIVMLAVALMYAEVFG